MKFNAYGRKIEVIRLSDSWAVFYLGNEGKKRTAHDIIIPAYLKAEEIKSYLEDIFHECATKDNNEIEVLD